MSQPTSTTLAADTHLFCLKFIQDELRSDTNPLSFRHFERYMQYLTKIESTVTEVERSLYDAVRSEAEIFQKRHRPTGNESGDISPRMRLHKQVKTNKFLVPLSVPFERRLQTAVALIFNLFTGIPFWIGSLCIALYFSSAVQNVFFIYVAFMIYDQRHPLHPSFRRQWEWFKGSRLLILLAEYFPVRLVRPCDVELNPRRNYLFGYHPHGVQAIGSLCAFGTYACNIHRIFPGLKVNLQTLPIQFNLPLWRELVIWTGCGDASKKTIVHKFKQGPGHSTCIVLGGAAESLFAAPNTARLILKKRMGFVKLAIQNGVDLVPTFAFGENDVYHNLAIHHPTLLNIQRRMQKLISFAPLLIQGRGIFNYSGGLLPHRRPIFVVCGKPIEIIKTEDPSAEMIETIHQKYMTELKALHERYKPIFDSDVSLTFE